jgi:hypothetical protein
MGDPAACESIQSDKSTGQAPESGRDLNDNVSDSDNEEEQPSSNES